MSTSSAIPKTATSDCSRTTTRKSSFFSVWSEFTFTEILYSLATIFPGGTIRSFTMADSPGGMPAIVSGEISAFHPSGAEMDVLTFVNVPALPALVSFMENVRASPLLTVYWYWSAYTLSSYLPLIFAVRFSA